MQNWYALHTKPHKEHSLEQFLSARGITTYLPMLPKFQQGRRLERLEPLFPCYLFAHLDLEHVGLSNLRWTPGLRDIVKGAEGPAIVEDHIIAHIQTRLSQKEILRSAAHDRFKTNERIRLKGSALEDLDALFERYLPGELRARVLVHILGRATPFELDVEMIERASPLRS